MEVKQKKKYFHMKGKKVLKAVDNVTIDIYKGEVLSLVGESGSGKTTMGRTVSRLYNKTAGDVTFEGNPIDSYSVKDFSRNVQMIFQDPQASLNPRMTVGDVIAEGIDIHKLCASKQERDEKIYELLETVGLNKEHAKRVEVYFNTKSNTGTYIRVASVVIPKQRFQDIDRKKNGDTRDLTLADLADLKLRISEFPNAKSFRVVNNTLEVYN